ncbi:D-glucuronyl C5-epimerase [Necator americanus]|uniref:heparosan-N-sulfate-glucuronate 5-epimerase n=1 Tax=Necator americanus TaxID=51031 RepID=W2T8Y1_NECAM|nr:D-glucuronyl C5-epimerase [Necator americanus]ETN77447.1 D-glucuronyl C5-epimerase [Necator americanus]
MDELSRLRKDRNKAKCVANNGKEMMCMRDENEYYFPFSFIKKQYDVSGKMSKDGSRFELFTSYSKIRVPDGDTYDPTGPFGHFATYSVETRERVRCISAETGVPMSTQWSATPYYYPIQIAQYGLQHYSRMIVNKTVAKASIKGTESTEWKGSAAMHDTSERVFYRDAEKGDVVNISTSGGLRNPGCYVFLDPSPRFHVLSFDWLPVENASFTILVRVIESDMLVLLNYVTGHDSRCVWNDSVSYAGAEQVSFSFSLGELRSHWYSVTRDALVDASRALSSMGMNKRKEGNVVLHQGIPCKPLIGVIELGEILQEASEGGVRNSLFGYVWYEEYPTSPGSFVLNGFMYSLIGLYDLSKLGPSDVVSEEIRLGTERASKLFSAGMDSLRSLLPLYDTGGGSIYDLRHVGLRTAPNLARWDYHAVHVYLLKWLVQISGDKTLDATADRWIAYSWGKKAKHN